MLCSHVLAQYLNRHHALCNEKTVDSKRRYKERRYNQKDNPVRNHVLSHSLQGLQHHRSKESESLETFTHRRVTPCIRNLDPF